MPFKYKKKSVPRIPLDTKKPDFADTPEQLVGEIAGMPASDLEERFYNMLNRSSAVWQKYFRMTLGAPRGLPGWLELDFLVETTYGWRAFEIDDVSFIHKGESERQEGLEKDLRRLDSLKKKGIDVREIEHVTNEELGTQEDANRWGQENI